MKLFAVFFSLFILSCDGAGNGSSPSPANENRNGKGNTYLYEGIADRPECSEETVEWLAYIKGDSKFYYCDGAEWAEINLKGEKGDEGVAGAAGPSGVSGTTGADGQSRVAFISANSQKYATIESALDDVDSWCPDRTIDNRCVIELGAGEHTLESDLYLPDYIALTGQGILNTTLSVGVRKLVIDDSSVSHMKISTDAVMKRFVVAAGSGAANAPVTTSLFENVHFVATNDQVASGPFDQFNLIFNSSDHSVHVKNSLFSLPDGKVIGIESYNGHDLIIENSHFFAQRAVDGQAGEMIAILSKQDEDAVLELSNSSINLVSKNLTGGKLSAISFIGDEATETRIVGSKIYVENPGKADSKMIALDVSQRGDGSVYPTGRSKKIEIRSSEIKAHTTGSIGGDYLFKYSTGSLDVFDSKFDYVGKTQLMVREAGEDGLSHFSSYNSQYFFGNNVGSGFGAGLNFLAEDSVMNSITIVNSSFIGDKDLVGNLGLCLQVIADVENFLFDGSRCLTDSTADSIDIDIGDGGGSIEITNSRLEGSEGLRIDGVGNTATTRVLNNVISGTVNVVIDTEVCAGNVDESGAAVDCT
ncbi:hypothetical protein N9D31_01590 [Oligoflexaceae bacterium]|nr:hypothetical protein [Oligoflexaceae bacterium]